jgi:hypothetical protein
MVLRDCLAGTVLAADDLDFTWIVKSVRLFMGAAGVAENCVIGQSSGLLPSRPAWKGEAAPLVVELFSWAVMGWVAVRGE